MTDNDVVVKIEQTPIEGNTELPVPAPDLLTPTTKKPDFEVTVLDEPRPTAVERTRAAMAKYHEGRKNQARAFFKRVKKSITKRKLQKAARKRNR